MKKLVPLLIVAIFVVGGGAVGAFLKPAATGEPDGEMMGGGGHAKPADEQGEADGMAPDGTAEPRDYVEIGRQMIIPVVEGDETRALMLFELAVDVPADMRDTVFLHEPRLRDAFLRELFAMSHTGAFLETFTDDFVIEELRAKLLAAARRHLGPQVADVLILDVMRQEM